jgi:hypothetical protein
MISTDLINIMTSCPEMEDSLTESLRPEPQRYKEYLLLKNKNHNLYELKTPVLYSREFSISEEEVVKCIEAISAVLELCTIVGIVIPRSRLWLRTHRANIQADDWVRYVRCNHTYSKAVHRLLAYVSLNGEGSWVKLLKWKFAAYFAFHRNQDLPERPNTKYPIEEIGGRKKISNFFSANCLIGGWIDDQLNSFKKNSNKELRMKFWHVVNTSQQLKKAMPDVPVSMIEQSVRDTVADLTMDPETLVQKQVVDGFCLVQHRVYCPLIDSDIPGSEMHVVLTKSRVVEALERTTDELFCDEVFTFDDLYEPFFPSVSANYIWSRGKCGSLNELYQKTSFGKENDLLQFGTELCTYSVSVSPHYGELGHAEARKITLNEEVGLGTNDFGLVIKMDSSNMDDKWREQFMEIFHLALAERPLVSAVGLAEPLKVRVISKGPPLTYTVLKPIQKWLWTCLKKNKVFSLIGRYVEERDVNRVLGKLMKDYIALSGDYVSSTNKLHSWVSEVILDRLMIHFEENLPLGFLHYAPDNFLVSLKELMLRALTKHIFVEDGVEKPQTEGQLMGSIISFPFLCIANAALCRLSMEESEFNTLRYRITDKPNRYSLGRILPCLINGDDCLLVGHKDRLRPCWEGFCAIAGLFSSLGKTYFSDSFCTINSTIFEWNPTSNWWTECKYVNLGLMKGQKRAGSGSSSVEYNSLKMGPHELGVIARELKRSCPPEIWLKVKSRFIYYNKKTLDKYPLSWFLPEWLGGIGLPVDHDNEISLTDRKMATVLKMKMNSDRKFKPVKPKDMAMWKMHELVMKDLKQFDYIEKPLYRMAVLNNSETIDFESQWAKLYKRMTINLLEKYPLESLYETINEVKSTHAALRHNADVQAYGRYELAYGSYDPMSDEDMLYENKDLVLPCWVGKFDDFPGLRL